MLNVLKKYSGVLFFYLVIIGMILLINARFASLNTNNAEVVTYSMSEWFWQISTDYSSRFWRLCIV